MKDLFSVVTMIKIIIVEIHIYTIQINYNCRNFRNRVYYFFCVVQFEGGQKAKQSILINAIIVPNYIYYVILTKFLC